MYWSIIYTGKHNISIYTGKQYFHSKKYQRPCFSATPQSPQTAHEGGESPKPFPSLSLRVFKCPFRALSPCPIQILAGALNVKPQDTATIRSIELLARLGIEDLDLILKERRLRWYGHVERSNGAVKTAFDIQVNGKRGPGRPKMTWKQLTERDRREWKLSAIDPHDRDTWRSGVRSAKRAASQLPGRGPTVVDMAPIPAC